MRNATIPKKAWALGLVLSAALGFGPALFGPDQVAASADPAGPRADLLPIDSPSLGKLDKPRVVFKHDQHTEALEKEGKLECKTCHPFDEKAKRYSLKYMRPDGKDAKEPSKEALVELYHGKCAACHVETASAGKKSGPAAASCGGCHVDAAKNPQSNWVDVGFDKGLHARHVKAAENPQTKTEDTCKKCHHQYDEKDKKLVYKEFDSAETCRYCHKDKAVKDKNGQEVRSYREGAHQSCITCHMDSNKELKSKGKKLAPVKCASCHQAAEQAKFAKFEGEIPRLWRKQPDFALVKPRAEKDQIKGEEGKVSKVAPVAFPHLTHEKAVKDCRTCHHEAMESCSKSCHTRMGAKEGGKVGLAQAMHAEKSMHSCVGCHNQKQKAKECAGCHDQMTKPVSEAQCKLCHKAAPEGAAVENEAQTTKWTDDPILKKDSVEAAKIVAARDKVYAAPDFTAVIKDVPEKVKIDAVKAEDGKDQYEPVELPHKKIIESMIFGNKETKTVGIKDSKLAGYFHANPLTFCSGCHHNQPESKTPAKCASCHGAPFLSGDSAKPGLKAAYHLQCVGCHKSMELAKPKHTDCNEGCHKPKK